MTGKLFLCGGGDEKQTFEVDEIFLKKVRKILYIPVAWKDENYQSCLNWFTNAMTQHKPVRIDMLTNLSDNTNLKNYDAVYIGGGNTFKLLKKIKDSKFDKKLLNYLKSDGTIYGGSAGAIIFGKDINLASICFDADENEVRLKDTSGLDMLKGYDIQCHYRNSQLKSQQQYAKETGRNILAVPEESAILLENEKYKVIGTKPITLIKSEIIKISPGEFINP